MEEMMNLWMANDWEIFTKSFLSVRSKLITIDIISNGISSQYLFIYLVLLGAKGN